MAIFKKSFLACSLLKLLKAAILQEPETFVSDSDNVCRVVLNFDAGRFESEMLQFNTRMYNGASPGPTIRVKPGDTIKVMLQNFLGDETDESMEGDVEFLGWNKFKYPNTTNLHFHGMHVSSKGKQDNMDIRVDPGKAVEYEVKIPENHPSGIYYYHPHFHGSVSIQMGGGAAGVIVVEDKPEEVPVELANMKEHILLLQHFLFEIQYYDGSNFGSKLMRHLNNNMRYINERTRSDIDLDIQQVTPADGMGEVDNSFHVNGQWLPTIKMQPGETAKFQVVNAGAAESVSLVIEREYPFKYDEDDLKQMREDQKSQLHCQMSVLAMDGVYLKEPWTVPSVHLIPGGRATIAVHCPKEFGSGRLIFGSAVTWETQTYIGATSHIHTGPMAYIEISGLPLAQNMPLPKTLPSRGYIDDLDAKMENAPEGDNWSIKWGRQRPKDTRQWAMNDDPYVKGDIKAEMTLGYKSEWCLVGDDYHPFHLHSHHFKIKEVWNEDDRAMEVITMKPGMWRDSIPTDKIEKTCIDILPIDFAGITLAHCHVPSHADQGMMSDVMIYPSDDNLAQPDGPDFEIKDADYSFQFTDQPKIVEESVPAAPINERSNLNDDQNNGASSIYGLGFTTVSIAALIARFV